MGKPRPGMLVESFEFTSNVRGGEIFLRLVKRREAGFYEVIKNGAVAQLGERMTGSHEVVGSIPSSSTRNYKGLPR